MATKHRLFLVEDHQLFREGVKAMLVGREEWEVIGEAADGLEAIRLIQKTKPDLVLLDLSMPRMNGFSVLREIKRATPEIKVLVLSIHETDQFVLQAFESGADGYAIKDSSRDELKLSIQTVLDGKKYVNPSMAVNVLDGYLNGGTHLKAKSALDSVTHREREVLKLLGEGYQNKEIAAMLHISLKTVEKHRANIMGKLDLHNAASLTAFAFENGLISVRA